MYHRIALPVDPMNPWLPSPGLVKALTGQNRAILRAIAVLEPFDLELHFGRPRREIAPRPTVVEARRRLKSLISDAELSEVIVETTAVEGSWLGSILDEIRKNSCDLLLVGGNGGEFPERLEELVPDLMLHAPVSVCSARASGPRGPVRRIVVATDLSENAFSAFEAALTLAEIHDASLHLVHLIAPLVTRGSRVSRQRLHRDAKLAVKVWREARLHPLPRKVALHEAVLIAGDAAVGIVAFARDLAADLLVVASAGWGAIAPTFLGSTARKIVARSEIPVLVVRPSGRAWDAGQLAEGMSQ